HYGNVCLAHLARARPHEPSGVREAQHSVRHPATELAALGVHVARVKLRIIAGETGEGYEVRVRDGPPRAPEGHSDVQVGIGIAESSLAAHRWPLRFSVRHFH